MNNKIEIDKRDQGFFQFKEQYDEIIKNYKVEHPNCDEHSDEGLKGLITNLLINNVKVSITNKGNISKTLCGHKIKEKRTSSDDELYGISITLYGKYENKTWSVIGLEEFNKWFDSEIKKCQKVLNKTEETEEDDNIRTSGFNNIVFSVQGNEYCFEDLNGVNVIFRNNGDNGIKLVLERLIV